MFDKEINSSVLWSLLVQKIFHTCSMRRLLWVFSSVALMIVLLLQQPKSDAVVSRDDTFLSRKKTSVFFYRITWFLCAIYFVVTLLNCIPYD